MSTMVIDKLNLFTKSHDLLTDVSQFVRGLNATCISSNQSLTFFYDEADIALQLEEDNQWKVYDV